METKKTVEEIIKSVTISERTRKFLTAHMMADEAAQIAADTLYEIYQGDIYDDMVGDMFEQLWNFQEEILSLMVESVKQNLASLSKTEI